MYKNKNNNIKLVPLNLIMELEEILKNPVFNRSELSALLYPNEDRAKVKKRFNDKLAKRNNNKFSEIEKEKLKQILSDILKKIKKIN